jgi:hypothetical protein
MDGEVLTKCQTKDGKIGYKVEHVERPPVQERKEILDELVELQPMEPQFMEDIKSSDEATLEKIIIPYKDMTDTQKGNIRMGCKIEFVQNNISPKDMWNPMPDKEETKSLLGNLVPTMFPKPKPLFPKIPGHINGTADFNDDDFFNKLGDTI